MEPDRCGQDLRVRIPPLVPHEHITVMNAGRGVLISGRCSHVPETKTIRVDRYRLGGSIRLKRHHISGLLRGGWWTEDIPNTWGLPIGGGWSLETYS